MNQRRDTRIRTDQSVAVTLFGDPDIHVHARVRNISGRGLGLLFERFVAPGVALQLKLEDALLLGEVIYCRGDGDGFYAGVELEQALCGLAELSRMVSAFAAASGPEQADATNERSCQNQQQAH